ncbi:hypothetical protein TEA_021044 [Camellia sinensis var. sinensis]|uniref:E2F transcription factor CC-MB domain-containing protein n=1 Tax=Camellia sinensis var. sinensis TaxID=542762 RepID=A0A4S4E855_CAMSN|nr:hypothetical protein TEA_021044 [Camellia sinensis var. sinensis]
MLGTMTIFTPFSKLISHLMAVFIHHKPTGRFCNGKLATDITADAMGFTAYPLTYLSPQALGKNLLIGSNFASTGSSYDDKTVFLSVRILACACNKNETLIAIKAPHDTTLEVPYPDERRYRVMLRSTMGPVDVYLMSGASASPGQFEEINGVAASPSIASTLGLNENPSTPFLTEESNQNEIEM